MWLCLGCEEEIDDEGSSKAELNKDEAMDASQ